MKNTAMDIDSFKQFTLNQYGLRIDFRSHVYLSNQYGLSPHERPPSCYGYDFAGIVLNSLFDFWHKNGVNLSGRYNKNMMVDQLRGTPLKQQLKLWLESEASA